MPYCRTKNFFIFSLLACSGLRVLLKLSAINPWTGFYEGSAAVVLFFNLLLAASCVWLLVRNLTAPTTAQELVSSKLTTAGAWLAFFGTFAITAFDLQELFHMWPKIIEFVDRYGMSATIVLQILKNILSPILVIFLLWTLLAVINSKGNLHEAMRAKRLNPYLLFLPAVWQLLRLIDLFMAYTASRSVSDQMLTIVMMVFGLLFFTAHGRLLGNVQFAHAARQTCAFGLVFALVAVSTSLGMIAAALTGQTVYDALELLPAIFYLTGGLYAATIVWSIQKPAS